MGDPAPFEHAGHAIDAAGWLGLAVVLLVGKAFGEAAIRLKQPPVLGEIVAGILLGNLPLFGFTTFVQPIGSPAVSVVAELGVILLLFTVGLESTLAQMKKVLPQAGLVAVIGVVVPVILGAGVTAFFFPYASAVLPLFVGATLSATSVGITARVLRDLRVAERSETRVILGAAVIDDVLGLVILAIVSAIAATGAMPGPFAIGKIVAIAVAFVIGAVAIGSWTTPKVFQVAARFRSDWVLGVVSIAICLLMAYVSGLAGLAPIVGAYAAGLILDDVKVRAFGENGLHRLEEFVAPMVAFCAPVFFVRTGMAVDLSKLTVAAALLGSALALVGIVGKLASSLGVRGKSIDRIAVGIGMIPRGEVGLIFADVGRRLVVRGDPLIDSGVYAALVLMVLFTTVVTPPLLAMRFRQIVQS